MLFADPSLCLSGPPPNASVPMGQDGTGQFGYYSADAAADQRQDIVPAFRLLAESMLDPPPTNGGDDPAFDGVLPPIYTYLGYLIEHDICSPCSTAMADDNQPVLTLSSHTLYPLQREDVLNGLGNRHSGGLRLESLYGDSLSPDMGLALRDPANPARLLPDGTTSIADPRNARHPILAKLQSALLRLHNMLALQLRPTMPDPFARFLEARKQTTWIWQWLVLNDYLPQIAETVVVDHALSNGAAYYTAFHARQGAADATLPVPLEYAFGVSGFSHGMIRAAYDLNTVSGRPFATSARDALPTSLLLDQPDHPPLPILLERLATNPPRHPDHVARAINSHLCAPLGRLPKNAAGWPRDLAMRTLQTGYRVSLPTAQATLTAYNQFARQNGFTELPALTLTQLASGPLATAVQSGGFTDRTPLWFYILKEAEQTAQGLHLGPMGSVLLSETLVGLTLHDPESFWHAPDMPAGSWHPSRLPLGGHVISSFQTLFEATGLLPQRSGGVALSVNGSARSITGA